MKEEDCMLQRIKKYYRGNKVEVDLRLKSSIFLFLFMLGNIYFFASWHNLDLLQNYSLMFSDINIKYSNDSELLNVREITDCTGFNVCNDFKSIYLNSKSLSLITIMLLDFLIINMVYVKWIKLNLKKSQ